MKIDGAHLVPSKPREQLRVGNSMYSLKQNNKASVTTALLKPELIIVTYALLQKLLAFVTQKLRKTVQTRANQPTLNIKVF